MAGRWFSARGAPQGAPSPSYEDGSGYPLFPVDAHSAFSSSSDDLGQSPGIEPWKVSATSASQQLDGQWFEPEFNGGWGSNSGGDYDAFSPVQTFFPPSPSSLYPNSTSASPREAPISIGDQSLWQRPKPSSSSDISASSPSKTVESFQQHDFLDSVEQIRALIAANSIPQAASAWLRLALAEARSSDAEALRSLIEECQMWVVRLRTQSESPFLVAIRSACMHQWQEILARLTLVRTAPNLETSVVDRLRNDSADLIHVVGLLFNASCLDGVFVLSVMATELLLHTDASVSERVVILALRALVSLVQVSGDALETLQNHNLLQILHSIYNVFVYELSTAKRVPAGLYQDILALVEKKTASESLLFPAPSTSDQVTAIIAQHVWDFCLSLNLLFSHIHENTCTQFNNCYQEWLRCLRLLARFQDSTSEQINSSTVDKDEQQRFQARLVFALFVPLNADAAVCEETSLENAEAYARTLVAHATNSSSPSRNWLIHAGCLTYRDSQDARRRPSHHSLKLPRRTLLVLHTTPFNRFAVDRVRRQQQISDPSKRVHSVPRPLPEPQSQRIGKIAADSEVVMCKYWVAGQVCRNGKTCRFMHAPSPVSSEEPPTESPPSSSSTPQAMTDAPVPASRSPSNNSLNLLIFKNVVRILRSMESSATGEVEPPLVAQVGFLLRRSFSQFVKSGRNTGPYEAALRFLDTPDGRLLNVLRRFPTYIQLEDVHKTGGHTLKLITVPADLQDASSLPTTTPQNDEQAPEQEVARLLENLLKSQRDDGEAEGLLVAPLGAVLRRQSSPRTQLYLDTQEGRLLSILKRHQQLFRVEDPKQNGGHVVFLNS